MTHSEAAAWARAYAAELEKGGWTSDAAYYRGVANHQERLAGLLEPQGRGQRE